MKQTPKPPFWRRESTRWGLTLGVAALMMAAAALLTPGLLGDRGNGHYPADAQPVIAGGQEAAAGEAGAETPVLPETEPEGDSSALPEPTDDTPALPEQTESGLEAEGLLAVSGEIRQWILPISGQISRGYGYDYNPSTEDYRFHRGCDIEAPLQSQVRAAAGGQAAYAAEDQYWGGIVIIDHGGGWKSVYKCVQPAVEAGESIIAGQIIGLVIDAPAEAAQASHVHVEMEFEGQSLDPLSLL